MTAERHRGRVGRRHARRPVGLPRCLQRAPGLRRRSATRSRSAWPTRPCAASSSMSTRPAARSAVFSTWSTRIAALKASAGKPLWAVANERRAVGCLRDRAAPPTGIYVTHTGEVGSIGVVAAHVDESGADAQAGLAWSFVFAGQQKVDGNAHEPLSQRARDDDPGRCRSSLWRVLRSGCRQSRI